MIWTKRHERLYRRLAEHLPNYDDQLVRDAIKNKWSFEETVLEGEKRDRERANTECDVPPWQFCNMKG